MRRRVRRWSLLAACVALQWEGAWGSPNHDELQSQTKLHTSRQRYGGGRRLVDVGSDSCEQIHTQPWEDIRIGWEFVDVGSVPSATLAFLSDTVLSRAVAYLQSTLQVHRVPPGSALRADRQCASYATSYMFEPAVTCETAQAPTCGLDGVRIPDAYLNSMKVCSARCAPQAFTQCDGDCVVDNACSCDIATAKAQGDAYCCTGFDAQAGCPADCTIDTVIDYGGASGICETCTTEPEGAGVAEKDFFALVTVRDTAGCAGDTQAYASTCVKDQCDRPIFAQLNFCLSKISLLAGDEDKQVSTAVHEFIHALGFSSRLFRYFRNADGTPKLARDADDATIVDGQVSWQCSPFQYGSGDRTFVDLTVHGGIVESVDERGISSCPCPLGQASMTSSCVVPLAPAFRTPQCVVKMVTPRVLEKVRAHFDCPTLSGAELENQDTSACVIIGSHWEQRIFMGELMAPVGTLSFTYLSEVTLALLEDSGWYLPRYSMADPLTKGVHWGYQQGCAFATDACVSNDATSFPRHWCTAANDKACNLLRDGVVSCLTALASAVPSQVSYFSSGTTVGSVPEADYCPFHASTITNRVCTDTGSSYGPISNVNFMREQLGAGSRCLESTLHADVPGFQPASSVGSFSAPVAPMPACYEVECAADNSAYSVKLSDLSGGTVALGECSAGGQTLTSAGYSGEVTCADPVEICGVLPALHTAGGATATTTTAGNNTTPDEVATSTTLATTSSDGADPGDTNTSATPTPEATTSTPMAPASTTTGRDEATGARGLRPGAGAWSLLLLLPLLPQAGQPRG